MSPVILEPAEGGRAHGVNHTLMDVPAVEVSVLREELPVLEKQRAAGPAVRLRSLSDTGSPAAVVRGLRLDMVASPSCPGLDNV